MTEKTLVLVETVSMFRVRYVIEVPKGNEDWALDTVVCNDAKEFSQKHLDETIVSHRTVTLAEALALSDVDNDYASGWSPEKKAETFITLYAEND